MLSSQGVLVNSTLPFVPSGSEVNGNGFHYNLSLSTSPFHLDPFNPAHTSISSPFISLFLDKPLFPAILDKGGNYEIYLTDK